MVPWPALSAEQPEIAAPSRADVAAELQARIASYTPTWTNRGTLDAGIALVRLFGELSEPVRARLNRLPEKSFVEYVRIAGVQPLPATPARAMLTFEVSASASQSSLVPEGFQVAATAADGSGSLIIFETERSLFATPGTIAEVFVQERNIFRRVELRDEEGFLFLPFGSKARTGRALLLGIDSPQAPAPFLSIGVEVAAAPGAPPPVGSGGLAPLPGPPPPLLAWEVFDGGTYKTAEVVVDETAGLARSGVVELRLPRTWRPGVPPGLDAPALRWLRLRLVQARFERDPALAGVRLNVVSVVAARTIRNEILEPVPGNRGPNASYRVSQSPVLAASAAIEVDEGGIEAAPRFAELPNPLETNAQPEITGTAVRWREVSDLALAGPDDRVFVFDAATGTVTFGDGVNGRALPEGFRHVRALRYQVGGGRGGAVDAEKIGTLLSSAPFVTGASNHRRATGGTDEEGRAAVMRRGPQEIRTRKRAVTVADYALMAARADGAEITRAHAVSGLHPAFPGLPVPGVVGVFVVPPDRGEGAPIADQQTLRRVAQFLSDRAAPAGVEVVVSATRYHRVRGETTVVVTAGADPADVVRRVLARLDTYLHPIKGGIDGTGWPFGGAIVYSDLVRQLLDVSGVAAVPRLTLVVDGRRIERCQDFQTRPNYLLWPEGYEVIPEEQEAMR
jgi:predicted phage baseplate assembly protein